MSTNLGRRKHIDNTILWYYHFGECRCPIFAPMPLLFNTPRQQTAFYRNAISGDDLNSTELVESTEVIGVEHGNMTFQNWTGPDRVPAAIEVIRADQSPFRAVTSNTIPPITSRPPA